jgi:lysyl-tRNA synthetase class 2
MLRRARRHFEEHSVLEVSTPVLAGAGVTDPAIESLEVSGLAGTAWLHTSPEYSMKRLLAAGYPDIFQVCPVFRGGEQGRRHLPEFTMIEWYRLGFGLQDIIEDCLSLVGSMLADSGFGEPAVIDYADAIAETLSLDPFTASASELADALEADQSLRRSLGDDRDAFLDLVMATRVATGFGEDRLTVVRHYPASQASLARLCPSNPAVADRFEVYVGPVELANGFVELTDPDEQLLRFEADNARRVAGGRPPAVIDMSLIDALRSGLPQCAGVALGLDRTLMIAEGRDSIDEVTTFTPGPFT